MWQVLGLLLLAGVSQAQCPAYACAPPGIDLGDGVCQAEVNDNFWMSLCPGFNSSYGCIVSEIPNTNWTCGTLPIPQAPLAYPGEPCKVDDDCVNSVICVGGVCFGSDVLSKCGANEDCDVGLYCNETIGVNGYCVYQQTDGEECENDYQCLNNLGCNGFAGSPGVCVPYYNLTNGHAVNNCYDDGGEGISKLCVSGACMLTTPGVNGPGTCVAAYTSKPPTSCTTSTQCVGTSGTLTTNKECVCGRSANGGGFCPLFSGDPPVMTVTQLTQKFLALDTSDCHTSARFSPYCFATHLSAADYDNYTQSLDIAGHFPEYQNNDYCTQANILNSYYELEAEDLSCPAYSCYGSPFTGSDCSAFNQGNNTLELRSCAAGNMCSVPDNILANGTCTQMPANQAVYAGSSCNATTICTQSTCQNGVCKGTALGGNCNSASECDVGLYCFNFKCTSLLPVGKSPCYADTDCVLNSGCNFNSQLSGTCTQYFSLPLNSQVYCDSTGFQPLCQSGMCQHTLGLNIGTCIPAAKSGAPGTTTSTPMLCKRDSDCVGYNGVATTAFTGKCHCGYNPQGLSYCDLFPGDVNYTYYTGLLNKVMTQTNAGNLPCQTARRFQPDCLTNIESQMNSDEPNQLLVAYYQAKKAPYLVNNDNCVQQTFTSYYWSLNPSQNGNNNHSNTTTGAYFAIVVSALWLTFA